MRRVIRVLNWFPQIKGRVWVDCYSLVALIRFALGKPVDSTTLGVVLGAYVINKVGQGIGGSNAQ